ncbi:MAG: site-specific DNA-methyltransferase [Thermoplasmatales archaeon]
MKLYLYQGDAKNILRKIESNSIDAIVSDPPYQLSKGSDWFKRKGTVFVREPKGFMGEEWDVLPDVEILRECLRVLKDGAFALWFMTPRQDSLLEFLIRLRDAGFFVGFTSLYWVFASGFPKGENISIAVDKKLGAEREIIGVNPNCDRNRVTNDVVLKNLAVKRISYITKPKTEQAKALDGAFAGYQPKPAVEVIIVSMKPLSEKTYVNQAMKNGKGITWLGNVRIPTADNNYKYPANLLVSDDILGDDFSKHFDLDAWWDERIKELPADIQETFPFFISPKANKNERHKNGAIRNIHPTVKPLKLVSYLITLVSKPHDVILDPFLGSGTTMLAAKLLNRNCIGIEKKPEYVEIAKQRLDWGAGLDIEYHFEKE